jgi:hypothetical protein
MDVKQAVAHAKRHIADLFADEGIKNLGLEEVDFDPSKSMWRVTIGFSRPWDEPRNALAAIAGQTMYWRRTYKVVHLQDDDGKVLSVKSLDVKE